MKAWIARDLDNSLWVYSNDKPYKDLEQKKWILEQKRWSHINTSNHSDFMELEPTLFPSVRWEDEEPTEVEIIIKPKKK